MAKPLQDRLYNLLPAIYRIQDANPAQGEALRALMALIEQQYLALEADVDQLYDDWFIETCQEWLVPYIGNLLGVEPLQSINPQVSSQRAYVANTLAYRQRKGTASVLEQLARDVTNWPARVVEYFDRLATTQNLNHLRPANHRTPNLRHTSALEQLGSPFETANYWPEVRRIASGRGRYNLPNVGLWLWRLQAYPLQGVRAKAVDDNPALGLYWCSPLGQDQPLFNAPNPETALSQLAEEVNLPAPLRRRPLHDEIEALVAGEPTATDYFDRTPPVQVSLDGVPVPPQDLVICDLSGEPGASPTSWRRPTLSPPRCIALDPVLGRLAVLRPRPVDQKVQVSYAYGFSGDLGGGPYDRRASLDPALLQRVTWQVGVSQTLDVVDGKIIHPSLADAVAAWNLKSANQELTGVIVLLDNDSYETDTTPPICIGAGRELLIVAADWPALAMPGQIERQEPRVGQLSPQGRRVHLQGDLQVRGTADADSQNPGRILLNGLLLEGRLTVQPGHLGNLQIDHCTLVPAAGGLTVEPAPPRAPTDQEPEAMGTNADLQVQIRYSITGPLYLAATVAGLSVSDSLVDGSRSGQVLLSAPIALPVDGEVQPQSGAGSSATLTLAASDPATLQTELATRLATLSAGARVALTGMRLVVAGAPGRVLNFEASDTATVDLLGLDVAPAAIASPDPDFAAPPATLRRCTILGSTYVRALTLASEVLFTATVVTQRQQVGCVRFSYVPPGSQVPRRYRCQPDLAIAAALEEAQQNSIGSPISPAEADLRRRIQRQLVPSFSAAVYGDPAYGQLSQVCPEEIRQGAEDGSEIGAFSFLKQPQRESNLRLTLDQYLRFGLEAGLFFAT